MMGYRDGAAGERERIVQIVEQWHISKGGYTEMANFIRWQPPRTPNHEGK